MRATVQQEVLQRRNGPDDIEGVHRHLLSTDSKRPENSSRRVSNSSIRPLRYNQLHECTFINYNLFGIMFNLSFSFSYRSHCMMSSNHTGSHLVSKPVMPFLPLQVPSKCPENVLYWEQEGNGAYPEQEVKDDTLLWVRCDSFEDSHV